MAPALHLSPTAAAPASISTPPSSATAEAFPQSREQSEGQQTDSQNPCGDGQRHHKRRTTQPELVDAISHPGAVRINVQGAFIVDEENGATTPSSDRGSETSMSLKELEDGGYEHDGKDIRLPNHTQGVSHIAVDIGGSLAKLVYFTREPSSWEIGGRLNFVKFETDKIDTCIEFMRHLQAQQTQNGSKPKDLCVMATGGGAFKYYDKIREALGVEVLREDEMECLIIGLDFFITEIPSEVFTYSPDSPTPVTFIPPPSPSLPPPSPIYPYLLVNIGSGVSMIKVSGPRQYTRIGGTSLGGGTLWGLLSLLTGARNFDDMLRLAEAGDNTSVDMLVGDIYGMDYNKIGLKSTAIASSFGKVYKMKRAAEREAEDHGGLANGDRSYSLPSLEPLSQDSKDPNTSPSGNGNGTQFRPEDISRSLLYAISNNIGQIAFLHANAHGLEHIYFGGSFIGGHYQTMNTLSYAINFWSKGAKKAYFLRHEGYLGAVGAFLKRQPRNWGRRGSLEGDEWRPGAWKDEEREREKA